MYKLSYHDIQSYLFYGAVYGDIAAAGRMVLGGCDTTIYGSWVQTATTRQLIDEGVRCLRQAARDALDSFPSTNHVVSLSGGFDSRAILAALLEHLAPGNLTTITFGIPGTFDYELPIQIARITGVPHHSFDARNVKWDLGNVIQFATREFESPFVPNLIDRYINYLAMRDVARDAVVWEGTLGDNSGGSHLPRTPSRTWDSARIYFVQRNHETKPMILSERTWDPKSLLPDGPFLSPDAVSMDDQLDVGGRESFRIRIPWRSYRKATIFDRPVWLSFIYSLPFHLRSSRNPLYRRIVAEAFPSLFKLPLQTNFGLGAFAPRPVVFLSRVQHRVRKEMAKRIPRLRSSFHVAHLQKFDYAAALARDTDYSALVHDLVRGLAARRVVDHLDIEELWLGRSSIEASTARPLRLLSSLELGFRVSELRRAAMGGSKATT